jgi:apolipoprotein N-acyltransferase
MNRWLRLLALGASGAGQVVLLPPLGAWWLSPLLFVPALWALQGLAGKRALAAGWFMGACSVLALGYWIAPTLVHFGRLPWSIGLLALLLYALVFGAYAGVFAWGVGPLRRLAGRWWPLPVAALWVACEFLNPQLFAHYLGLAFHDRPAIFLLAALTGVAGISFQMVLWSGVVVAWLEARALPRGPATVALVLLAATLCYGRQRGEALVQAQHSAATRRIALLQDNLDVAMRNQLGRQGPSAIAEQLVAQSRRALDADPRIEVLVWAEGALPGTPLGQHARAVRELVSERGIELWTGGHAFEDDRRFNAAFRLHGAVVEPPYRKNILIPFGEYLPLADTFPSLQRLWQRGRNHPGQQQLVFTAPVATFAFLICYEVLKSSYVRPLAARSVDLLVNLTYDGWFGDTSCPHLHLAAAALQSAQLGLPMARVSSTGISAFIDARGVITARTPLFTPAVLVADVPRLGAPGVYARLGDWFAWGCVAATALLLVLAQRRR